MKVRSSRNEPERWVRRSWPENEPEMKRALADSIMKMYFLWKCRGGWPPPAWAFFEMRGKEKLKIGIFLRNSLCFWFLFSCFTLLCLRKGVILRWSVRNLFGRWIFIRNFIFGFILLHFIRDLQGFWTISSPLSETCPRKRIILEASFGKPGKWNFKMIDSPPFNFGEIFVQNCCCCCYCCCCSWFDLECFICH